MEEVFEEISVFILRVVERNTFSRIKELVVSYVRPWNGQVNHESVNYILVLHPEMEVIRYNWMDLRILRKPDVGIMISCHPMMSSSFTSGEMGHNPQAPGPDKKQAHSCWRKNPGRNYDFIRRSYRNLRKTWELRRNDRFVWLVESMDLSELSSSTREILQCLWGWLSVRMRDSLNLIQSNDLGAEWIDHHANLLLSFALAIWNGKSRVT